MNRRHWRAFAASIASIASIAPSRSAHAEESTYHEAVHVPPHPRWVTVPLEIGHSTLWLPNRGGPLYGFDVAFLPGLIAKERWGFHLGGELHYRNPHWDVGPGARVDYLVAMPAGGFVPLRVLAGTNWLARANALRLEGGFAAGLGKLLTLSLTAGYETDREVKFLHLALGVDLIELSDPIAGIAHYVPQEIRQ